MKKGFTLIELLAVILILGIIALIAIPTVNNILEESRMGAFKTSVNQVAKSAEQNCQLQQLRNENITGNINFTNGEPSINLEYKGSGPDTGYMNVTNDCGVTFAVADTRYCAVKETVDDEIKIGKLENGVCKIDDVDYELVSYTPEDCFDFNPDTKTITDYLCGLKGSDSGAVEIPAKYYPDVVIPRTINGVQVENIGRAAFDFGNISDALHNGYYYHGINSVVLHDGIKNIYYDAFSSNNISYIKVPPSIELFDRWLESNVYVVVDARDGLPNPVTYDNYGAIVYARTVSCSGDIPDEYIYEILLPERSTELEEEFANWWVEYVVEEMDGYVRYKCKGTQAIC